MPGSDISLPGGMSSNVINTPATGKVAIPLQIGSPSTQQASIVHLDKAAYYTAKYNSIRTTRGVQMHFAEPDG